MEDGSISNSKEMPDGRGGGAKLKYGGVPVRLTVVILEVSV
jgi:hypothetical protein